MSSNSKGDRAYFLWNARFFSSGWFSTISNLLSFLPFFVIFLPKQVKACRFKLRYEPKNSLPMSQLVKKTSCSKAGRLFWNSLSRPFVSQFLFLEFLQKTDSALLLWWYILWTVTKPVAFFSRGLCFSLLWSWCLYKRRLDNRSRPLHTVNVKKGQNKRLCNKLRGKWSWLIDDLWNRSQHGRSTFWSFALNG